MRDDAGLTSLKAIVQVPSSLTSLTPAIMSTTVDLVKTCAIPNANYTLYTVLHLDQRGTYTRTYDLVASNATHTVERKFNELLGIPTCPFSFASGA